MILLHKSREAGKHREKRKHTKRIRIRIPSSETLASDLFHVVPLRYGFERIHLNRFEAFVLCVVSCFPFNYKHFQNKLSGHYGGNQCEITALTFIIFPFSFNYFFRFLCFCVCPFANSSALSPQFYSRFDSFIYD